MLHWIGFILAGFIGGHLASVTGAGGMVSAYDYRTRQQTTI